MRVRLLAVALILAVWATSPVVGLVVSVHLLEHESAGRFPAVDPALMASHGHHHELAVPDHNHDFIQATGIQDTEPPTEQPEWRPSLQELHRRPAACLVPAGLPPPELHVLCAMLL